MILVTAATAPVGRAITEQLLSAGVPVRALSRNPDKADLPAGVEVVAGDLVDPASLPAALEGVSAVFLLAVVPGFAPAFLEAARAAGVRRIVFQSSGAIEDAPDGRPTAEQPNDVAQFHADIERAIADSGLGYTFLRLEVASSFALHWAFDVPGQLERGDVVVGPYADAAGSPIHPADIAAVAVAALTSAEHEGAVYRLTGPESLTHTEQIARLGRSLGRELQYVELPPDEARAAMSPYAPADVLFADWVAHRTEPAPVTDTVRRVTGREPRPFTD